MKKVNEASYLLLQNTQSFEFEQKPLWCWKRRPSLNLWRTSLHETPCKDETRKKFLKIWSTNMGHQVCLEEVYCKIGMTHQFTGTWQHNSLKNIFNWIGFSRKINLGLLSWSLKFINSSVLSSNDSVWSKPQKNEVDGFLILRPDFTLQENNQIGRKRDDLVVINAEGNWVTQLMKLKCAKGNERFLLRWRRILGTSDHWDTEQAQKKSAKKKDGKLVFSCVNYLTAMM